MKYPDAEIRQVPAGYYVLLQVGGLTKTAIYLSKEGKTLEWSNEIMDIYFPNEESAQEALNKYNISTRDYPALKQEGIDKKYCPPEYIYIGHGNESGKLGDFWGTKNLCRALSYYSVENTGWDGSSKNIQYCVPVEVWNEKFTVKIGEKKPITLAEIKSKYEEAKKFIGKNIIFKGIGGKIDKFNVDEIKLNIEKNPNSSCVSDEFYDKHGYVIEVKGGCKSIPFENCELNKSIEVKNHNGTSYTAASEGDFWVFGCAKIDKSLIRAAYELLNKSVAGNRSATKVTIGAADFDKETLKALVDAS